MPPNITSACQQQIDQLFKIESWITGAKMLDAWGKIGSGYLRGRQIDLGDYDECVEIYDQSPTGLIKGKYCYIPYITVVAGVSGRGICIPNHCQLPDEFNGRAFCQTKDSYSTLDDGDYLMIACLVVLALIVISSTFYEIWMKRFNEEGIALFKTFSIISNGEKLFCTKILPNQITCLAGLRSIAMMWIIAAHRYSLFAMFPIYNPLDGINFYLGNWSFYISGAYTGIDTFIYIGGFVVSYQCMINVQVHQLTIKKIPTFYLNRLLRLLPPLITMFGLAVTIIRRILNGPIYPVIMESIRNQCLDHALPYFVFLQNYLLGTQEQVVVKSCLLHTWYLDMDMQLYLLSPLILIPLCKCTKNKNRTLSYWTCGFFLCFALFVPMVIDFFIVYNYYHAHVRINSYVLGIITGYILAEFPNTGKTIHKWVNVAIWVTCIAAMTFCVFKIGHIESITNKPTVVVTNMYNTFGRSVWCLCLTWIVFSCHTNKNGFLNKFLSNSFFMVVAKLSFGIYLLHIIIMVMNSASTRTPIWFSFWPVFLSTISDAIVAGALSIVWVLCLESPIIALTKELLRGKRRKNDAEERNVTSL